MSEGAPTILLIDDNEDNLDVYAQFLSSRGLRVLAARDGMEGLAQAAIARPDAIVLDLGLPKMDGWEVATRLKAHPATRAIPIIALTAHALAESRVRAMAAGADEFLTKPCLPQELLDVIRQYLPRPVP